MDFVSQRHFPTRPRDRLKKKKKKKKTDASADPTPRETRSADAINVETGESAGVTTETIQSLRELQEELKDALDALEAETQYADLMKATAELALRALDASLGDGKWSTCVTPPSGSKPGETFQWSDKGINATNVTVPPDWASGPVLVRLHRTPVAPRLPPPSANVKERPLRANWTDGNFPIVGVAQTTPVKFSTEWKEVFKAAGIRKEDLSDPVKAARIQLALALSWDAAAALPELQGFTDKLSLTHGAVHGPHAQAALSSPDDAKWRAEHTSLLPLEEEEVPLLSWRETTSNFTPLQSPSIAAGAGGGGGPRWG